MTSRKPTLFLQTPFGTRGVYESVSYCNRCGMCASVCPSYQQTKQEPFSPRGRNQTLRLFIEGKLKKESVYNQVQAMVSSCTLCGRCTQQCPGQIPTAQHVLQLRRLLGINLLPRTLFYLLRLRHTAPRLFAKLVKTGLGLRKTGLVWLLSWVPGFAWLRRAQALLPVDSVSPTISTPAERPTLIYLPSLEAEFFMPALFAKTHQLASRKYRPVVWQNTASGLFEYVYGDIRRARQLVRQLILRHARTQNGKLPLLTDSIDVYNFLVQAPQLFAAYPTFAAQARHFAGYVRFVTDLLPRKGLAKQGISTLVYLAESAAFTTQSIPQQAATQILQTLFKKNFVQCGYNDISVASLGYGFVKHTRAPDYALQAVRTVTARQIQTVFVLSGLAQLEWTFYLHKQAASAQVRHVVELNG